MLALGSGYTCNCCDGCRPSSWPLSFRVSTIVSVRDFASVCYCTYRKVSTGKLSLLRGTFFISLYMCSCLIKTFCAPRGTDRRSVIYGGVYPQKLFIIWYCLLTSPETLHTSEKSVSFVDSSYWSLYSILFLFITIRHHVFRFRSLSDALPWTLLSGTICVCYHGLQTGWDRCQRVCTARLLR